MLVTWFNNFGLIHCSGKQKYAGYQSHGVENEIEFFEGKAHIVFGRFDPFYDHPDYRDSGVSGQQLILRFISEKHQSTV